MTYFSRFLLFLLVSTIFTACTSHFKDEKTLQTELDIANSCINKKIKLEMDCYDLLAYKSSFANLRLGVYELKKGNSKVAHDRLEMAQKAGNFYANLVISSMYENGIYYDLNEEIAIKLLKDVEKLDPLAAYKISFYYLSNDNVEKAIKLLEFSAKAGVKDAQKELVMLYTNSQYVEANPDMAILYDTLYQDKKDDFSKKIYAK